MPKGSYQRRDSLSIAYASDQLRAFAIDGAEQIQSTLEPDSPSFIKSMLKSSVTGGFWLSLPQHFCTSHLPAYDETITLVDEEGNEFPTKYLAHKHGLSGGWRGFAMDHQLVDGDALVFHLVTPTKFKVYICRTSTKNEVDEYLTFNPHLQQLNCAPLQQIKTYIKSGKKARHMWPSLENSDTQNNSLVPVDTTTTPYNDIGSIEDFTILVDGFCIDSIIPDHQKTKYYKLCCSQNSLLHTNLLKSLNHTLSAEIIIQTVNIANAIRDSDITTSKVDFKLWDTTLKGFEVLGMNVGFMRAHLNTLMNLLAYSEEPVESQKHRELVEKQMQVKEIIRQLELELLELKEEDGKLDVEMETARVNIDNYRSKFQEEVDAPWTMV